MSDYEFEEEEFTTQFNGKVLARMLQQTRPYWLWGVGFVILVGATSVMDAYFTYLGKQMIDEAILLGDFARLRTLAETYASLVLVEAVQVFGFIYLASVLGERVQYDIRKELFEHLQTLSFSYFDKTPVGWIMSRVTSDSQRIADLVTWGLVDATWRC
jgi:ATP-binding cassette subfamily B protein